MTSNVGWLTFIGCCSIALLLCTGAPPEARGQQAAGPPAAPGTESGIATFQARCSMCHANSISERKGVRGAERAPTTDVIRQMSPERIYQSITAGSMQEHAKSLADIDKVRLAEFMSVGSPGTELEFAL